MKLRVLLVLILFVISLVFPLALGGCFAKDDTIHIAIAVGVNDTLQGSKAAYQGAQLYIDEVNQKGGINGKKIKLEVFDDKNEKKEAIKVAKKIARDSQVLAVIGHYFSATSIAAGEVYREVGIPAVSGSATAEAVTQGNDWYFRTIFDNSTQGSFLANYIYKILGQTTATLIYDPKEPYSRSLARNFETEFLALKGQIANQWQVDGWSKNLDEQMDSIAATLASTAPEKVGVIVTPMLKDMAAKAVFSIKSRGLPFIIVGGDSVGSSGFVQQFEQYSQERQQVGYFSEGVYSIVPIIYDVLGETGQQFKSEFIQKFGKEPNASSAKYYDAAKAIVTAIRLAGVSGGRENLAQERRKVRDALAGIDNAEKAFMGIGGPVYFTADRNVIQPAGVGVWRGQQLVSAFTQLTPLTTPKTAAEIEGEIQAGRIVQVGNQYLNKTDIVYTAIRPYAIGELNLDKKVYQLDFNLWFRYQSNYKIDNIQFLNAVDNVRLGNPIANEEKNGIKYRLYSIRGKFRADFLPGRKYGQHIVGVNFVNKNVNYNNLIYVIDVLGLSQAENEGQTFLKSLQSNHVLDPASQWSISKAYFFQNPFQKESQGELESVNAQNRNVRFSRFNLAMTIDKNQISIRRIIPSSIAMYFLLLGSAIAVCLLLPYRYKPIKLSERGTWFIEAFSSILLLFAAEVVLVEWLEPRIRLEYLELTILIFNTLWWLVPAYLLVEAIDRFFWKPLEKKTNQPIPTLLQRMVLIVIYLLAIFGVIAYVFHQPITSLLGASGLFLTIVGLAIQINISNIFSGLAINLEKAFQLGDYIEIPALNLAGFVTDINWRSTRIRTRSGNIVMVPNSDINNKTIINYMLPNRFSRASFTFCLEPNVPASKAIDVLTNAVNAVAGKGAKYPLEKPEPYVIVHATHPIGVDYLIRCWYVPADCAEDDVRDGVTRSVLEHLQQAGLRLAYSKVGIVMSGKDDSAASITSLLPGD